MKSTDLSPNKNGNNNLTAALGVTGNVSRELLHVRHDHSLLGSGSGAADTLAEADLLTGRFAHEWSQKQELVLS
jgi:hypothetical protein